MNFHPIIVHFPIALLTVYCVLEFIRWNKLTDQPYWFYIKAALVMLGGLGALAALYTGDGARQTIRNDLTLRPVVDMHENFAHITTAIFGVIAFCYLVSWVQKAGWFQFTAGSLLEKLWNVLLKLKHAFIETRFVILAALAGLVSVTITGALGGYMVYGENIDPMVKIVYHLFFR